MTVLAGSDRLKRVPALVGLVIALALVLVLPGGSEVAVVEVKKLTASDRQDSGQFGRSVTISGDTAVVGAEFADGGHFRAGTAYVFQRDEGGADNWGEMAKLTASDGQSSDQFGRSVTISGDTAVVGATLEDAGGSAAGAAYVFQRDEGGANNWGEVAKLTASDAGPDDHFGNSVAVSGGTILVGRSAGAAYVFQRDEGGADNWDEVKKLVASDIRTDARFGGGLAVNDDTAIVGASSGGRVYVFQRDEGGTDNWGEVTRLTPSGTGPDDRFSVVGVSGAIALVRVLAGVDATGVRSAGAVHVFERDAAGADGWREVKKLSASEAGAYDVFGRSLEFGRDTAAVDNWGEVNKLLASDPHAGANFGHSVAVNGDTAIIGSPTSNAGGIHSGAALVFERDEGGTESRGLSAAVAAGIVALLVAGLLYDPQRYGQRRDDG